MQISEVESGVIKPDFVIPGYTPGQILTQSIPQDFVFIRFRFRNKFGMTSWGRVACFNLLVISLFSLLLNTSLIYPQNNWTKQESSFGNNFSRVFFADSSYGWITGDSGLVISTSNGGINWIKQSGIADDYLNNIFFLNRTNGWVTAWNVTGNSQRSIIYSTTNSGINWNRNVFQDTASLINTIYFLNPQNGFLGCVYSPATIILRTTNGGLNWSPVNTDSNFTGGFPVRAMNFMNQNTGFATGGFFDMCGVIWKTTNGGSHWTSRIEGSEPLNSIAFPVQNKIFISGGDFEYGMTVISSVDGGANWNYNSTGVFGIGYSVAFRNSYEGWIASGYSQKFLYTQDTGKTWTAISTPDSASLYSITFPNQRTGWAVGDKGAIYKYIAGSIGITNNGYNIENKDFVLYGNYPNPFNSTTKISYALRYGADVSYKIFDINGREIFTELTGFLESGVHESMIDMNGYSTGIYYIRVTVQSNNGRISTATRKIVYLK